MHFAAHYASPASPLFSKSQAAVLLMSEASDLLPCAPLTRPKHVRHLSQISPADQPCQNAHTVAKHLLNSACPMLFLNPPNHSKPMEYAPIPPYPTQSQWAPTQTRQRPPPQMMTHQKPHLCHEHKAMLRSLGLAPDQKTPIQTYVFFPNTQSPLQLHVSEPAHLWMAHGSLAAKNPLLF